MREQNFRRTGTLMAACIAWIMCAGPLGCAPRGSATTGMERTTQAAPISIETLEGRIDRAHVKVSPDGMHIAYLAATAAGNVLRVRSLGTGEDWALTGEEPLMGIVLPGYRWMPAGDQILCIMRQESVRGERLILLDLAGDVRDVTPEKAHLIRILAVDPARPDEALISADDQAPGIHVAYVLDVRTGKMTPVAGGSANVAEHVPGAGLSVEALVLRVDGIHESGRTVAVRDGGDPASWRAAIRWLGEDADVSAVLHFSADGRYVLIKDSRGRDTTALVLADLETGRREIVAGEPWADVGDVMIDARTDEVLAVSFDFERPMWTVLSDAVRTDFRYLAQTLGEDFGMVSRSADDGMWVVGERLDSGLLRYHVFDRFEGSLTPLFLDRTWLESAPLCSTTSVLIPARDGATLVGYITLPRAAGRLSQADPLPMVLLVRADPWERERLTLNRTAQWLASRGYAVLTVNTRGARGFGKAFKTGGDKQWGGVMHDDLVDAGRWAVDSGHAIPGRLAIMGTTYGGVAASLAVIREPELFAAGVSVNGALSLLSMVEAVPKRFEAARRTIEKRVGSARNDRRDLLMDSPLTGMMNLENPLLFIRRQGDARYTAKDLGSLRQIVPASGAPLVHVEFAPQPATGGANPADVAAINAITESFLAYCLGGYSASIDDTLANSSANILTGEEFILWQQELAETVPPVMEDVQQPPLDEVDETPPTAPQAQEATDSEEQAPLDLPELE
ncbi:MAG: S9 family peptidase [Phycisphaerales bacterium]|nr:S9 family peptidase [Phycisphaerales bacterium]